MERYISINKNLEVKSESVAALVNSMTIGQQQRTKILQKHGITLNQGDWHNQQNVFNALKEIHENTGNMNLEMIGKAIIDNAEFPPIKDLREGLIGVNIAYHMNHRLGKTPLFNSITGDLTTGFGGYELVSFNEASRRAIMICCTGYPTALNIGIVRQIVRLFKPKDSILHKVELDTTHSNAKEDKLLITW